LTWWQFVLDKGHFDVFAFFVITTDLKNKTFLMGSDLFLGHTLHHLGHCHLQSFFTLCWWHKKRIKQTDALGNHGDLQSFFLFEVLNELFESDFPIFVFNEKTIPKRQFALFVFYATSKA
jgi:hypothetical protein